jgi:hypothetical protein
MTSELFAHVATQLTDDTQGLVPHLSKNEFTLKRIPWSRRMWLLLCGKQSPKWSTASAPILL